MRPLWFGRALIGLADVVVLRLTMLGPQGPFPPNRSHSFVTAAAMPLFTMTATSLLTPASRQALAGLAVRAGLTHVPVQLSQVPRLEARRAPPRALADPRNVWAVVRNIISPAASLGSAADHSENTQRPTGIFAAPQRRAWSDPFPFAFASRRQRGHAGSTEIAGAPDSEYSHHSSHATAKLSGPALMEETRPNVAAPDVGGSSDQ